MEPYSVFVDNGVHGQLLFLTDSLAINLIIIFWQLEIISKYKWMYLVCLRWSSSEAVFGWICTLTAVVSREISYNFLKKSIYIGTELLVELFCSSLGKTTLSCYILVYPAAFLIYWLFIVYRNSCEWSSLQLRPLFIISVCFQSIFIYPTESSKLKFTYYWLVTVLKSLEK